MELRWTRELTLEEYREDPAENEHGLSLTDIFWPRTVFERHRGIQMIVCLKRVECLFNSTFKMEMRA